MNYFLFANANGRDLGILRTAVFGIWFVIILFSPLANYALLPGEIFKPWGVSRYLLTFLNSLGGEFYLNYSFLLALKIALLIGCGLCMLGIRPYRWVAVPTTLLLFGADAIIKGFGGYINHAELALLYAALVISLFPAADGFTISGTGRKSDHPARYRIGILMVAVMVIATYYFVGMNRLFHFEAELIWGNSTLGWLLVNSSRYSKYGFDLGLLIVHSKPLLVLFKAGFVIVTVCEVLAPFVLFNRKFCYAWLAVIIPFHFLSLFTMNIFFWENLVLLFLLLIYTYKKAPA